MSKKTTACKPCQDELYWDTTTNARDYEVRTEGSGRAYPSLEWKSVFGYEVGEISGDGKTVSFWVTPVFGNLFYSNCNASADAAKSRCMQLRPYQNSPQSYYAGVMNSNAEAVGLCCGYSCSPGFSSATCGNLVIPNIASSPGKIVDVVSSGYTPERVKAQYDAVMGLSYAKFSYLLDRTKTSPGDENSSRFIPYNVGTFLMKKYCLFFDKIISKDYLFFWQYTDAAKLRSNFPAVFNEIAAELCKGNKVKNNLCREYCNRKETNCDAAIAGYCGSLPPNEALNKENSELCGCFMGNQFYKGYFDEIQKRYKFPLGTPPDHTCYFPYCSSSNTKPYFYKQNPTRCPDVFNCFQSVDITFNTNGTISTGDININQTANCNKLVQKKCTTETDCASIKGSKCVNGVCESATPPPVPPVLKPQQIDAITLPAAAATVGLLSILMLFSN